MSHHRYQITSPKGQTGFVRVADDCPPETLESLARVIDLIYEKYADREARDPMLRLTTPEECEEITRLAMDHHLAGLALAEYDRRWLKTIPHDWGYAGRDEIVRTLEDARRALASALDAILAREAGEA